MSNYFYKGVNLSQIYVNDGKLSNQDNYTGIPTISNDSYVVYSMVRPLNFGYSYRGDNLNNITTSYYSLVNETGNIKTPTNCKSINIICVGGGGGGGGSGGGANAKAGLKGDSSSSSGGDGGQGGFGYYYTGKLYVQGGATYEVTIGGGGGGGGSGTGNYISGAGGDASTQGKAGETGGAGSPSGIKIGNNFYGGSGGNGGNGGIGAIAFAKQNTSNSSKGDPGSSGNSPNSTYNGAPNSYPQLELKSGNTSIPYGIPGSGGSGGNPGTNGYPGNSGVHGSAIIVYLYD